MVNESDDESWVVYVLQSQRTGVLYTGVSTDVARRLRQHNGELEGGSHTTTRGRPWTIVHTEGPMTRADALRREYAIKSWPRKKKLALVALGHPPHDLQLPLDR